MANVVARKNTGKTGVTPLGKLVNRLNTTRQFIRFRKAPELARGPGSSAMIASQKTITTPNVNLAIRGP